MLKVKDLAKEINKAIGATDKDGLPINPTPEMETYARAILTLTKASTAHTTGTVIGVTNPASPLTNGTALNGLLVNFTPTNWLKEMTAGFPSAASSSLSKEATASVGYINGAAKINFTAGKITGTCTNTAEAPGPLTNGAGTGGKIDSLQGSTWSKAIIPPLGSPVLAEKIYKAIVNYINKNAEVSYSAGSVTGTCPPASGTLQNGTATNGIIK